MCMAPMEYVSLPINTCFYHLPAPPHLSLLSVLPPESGLGFIFGAMCLMHKPNSDIWWLSICGLRVYSRRSIAIAKFSLACVVWMLDCIRKNTFVSNVTFADGIAQSERYIWKLKSACLNVLTRRAVICDKEWWDQGSTDDFNCDKNPAIREGGMK